MPDRSVGQVALISEATVLDAPGFTGLADLGIEVVRVPRAADEAAQIESLTGYFGIVAGAEPYSREVLEALPGLRIIARSGVGFDAIDIDAANDLGIYVTVTAGVNAIGVAEHALSMLLALLHRSRAYHDRVSLGRWRDGEFFDELHGSTVGIIGYGRIGRSFARIIAPLDVAILVYDPAILPDLTEVGVTLFDDIGDMLPKCDVVSLHVPLNESTRHLLGARQFGLLPKGAIVVNTSRGPVLDESALVDALMSGHLGGAALDVMDIEPAVVNSPLIGIDNCILSPHISSFGKRTISMMSHLIVEQLDAASRGEPPEGLVSLPALTGRVDPRAAPR